MKTAAKGRQLGVAKKVHASDVLCIASFVLRSS